MTQAILCIGSNDAEHGAENLLEALRLMSFADIRILDYTEPYASKGGYVNVVAKLRTGLDYDRLHTLTKMTERHMGRTPEMKETGYVPVDVDIVVFGRMIVRPNDYNADYFRCGYEMLKSHDNK